MNKRHAIEVASDLAKLVDLVPEKSDIIQEAVSALYRQAATIAMVKGALK